MNLNANVVSYACIKLGKISLTDIVTLQTGDMIFHDNYVRSKVATDNCPVCQKVKK